MGELSLHLKYRPRRFKEFYGNREVLQRLVSHLLKPNRSHFYLISGPYGCGKTTLARLIAMAVNCDVFLKECDVCTVCQGCRAVLEGGMDFFEVDGATYRGINDVRRLRELAFLRPFELRNKVFVVDEAHQLTDEASSALLKLLEEPLEFDYFILVTTEKMRIRDTIRSRAFHVDLMYPSSEVLRRFVNDICEREGITGIDFDSLNVLSFRDALFAIEGGRSAGEESLETVSALWRMIVNGDFVGISKFVVDVLRSGKRGRDLFLDFIDFVIVKSCEGRLKVSREFLDYLTNLYVNMDKVVIGGEVEHRFLERVFGLIAVAYRMRGGEVL